MIYKLWIKNNEGKLKEFYLTEDSQNKVMRRACSTYGVSHDAVTIVSEFKETPDYGYVHSKDFVVEQTKKDLKKIEQASMLYKGASGRCEPYKTQYKEKYGFEEFTINSEDDIIELLNKYKKVKVYWETTEKRGEHKYYAFCK